MNNKVPKTSKKASNQQNKTCTTFPRYDKYVAENLSINTVTIEMLKLI